MSTRNSLLVYYNYVIDVLSSDLAAKLGKLNVDDGNDAAPRLQIYRSREFDLSKSSDLEQAAHYILTMGKYLEEEGPLLKNIPTATETPSAPSVSNVPGDSNAPRASNAPGVPKTSAH